MSVPADVTMRQLGLGELCPMVRTGKPADHVSAVVRDLCIKLGHFAADDDAVEGERDYTLMELGSAFEEAVVTGLSRRYARSDPDRYLQPGELIEEGLIGTPDLLDAALYAIIEIKLTKLSMRHGPDSVKFWKYWMQLGAYCYMAQTTIGLLHVCHLNGDYKENRSPVYRVYEAHWTMDELRKIWRTLQTHRTRMGKQ